MSVRQTALLSKVPPTFDTLVFRNHPRCDVIGHFRDADKDIPVWAIFEIMTLGNFGSFYDCLDDRVKTSIVQDLGMPSNLDSKTRLKEIIFALKDFRNAIAHNGVVLDVRFQSDDISTGLTQLLKQEMDIGKVDFNDITDYAILLVYLMRCMNFTRTECRQLLTSYEAIINRYHAILPFDIYSRLVRTDPRGKIVAARRYVNAGRRAAQTHDPGGIVKPIAVEGFGRHLGGPNTSGPPLCIEAPGAFESSQTRSGTPT